MIRQLVFLVSFVLALASGIGGAAGEPSVRDLAILPQKVSLPSTEARQLLVVQWKQGEQFLGQAAKDVVCTSADPKVVKIEDGVAVPVSNGKTKITAQVGELRATAEVSVTGQDQPFTWSFR